MHHLAGDLTDDHAASNLDVLRSIVVRRGPATLSETVASELEAKILRGELQAGERLPTEVELCDLLGVSRSVVRDAVRTLAARGFVQVRQGVGMIVAPSSDVLLSESLLHLLMRSDLTVGDVIDARAAIEIELCGLAAERGNDTDWQQLGLHLERFASGVANKNWWDAHEEHLAFHLTILRSIHLPALELMMKPMQEFILLSSLPPHPNDHRVWEVPSHEPILAALRRRDADGARRAMEAHFGTMTSDAYARFRETPFRQVVLLETLDEFRAQRGGRGSGKRT
jgi:GntR family transcriptional repressor for pyruvate dehydrogenase complex